MDEALIERWNQVVTPNDQVYHLGDFTFGGYEEAEKYFARLNGFIKVLSNPWHLDSNWLPENLGLVAGLVSQSGSYVRILPPMVILDHQGKDGEKWPQTITLFHYPLLDWDRRCNGSWHLHAQSSDVESTDHVVLNVGVAAWDYFPVSLEQIVHNIEGMSAYAIPKVSDMDEMDWKPFHRKSRTVRAAKLSRAVKVGTLKGVKLGDVGDWLIEGIEGELYFCPPNTFAATYETLEE